MAWSRPLAVWIGLGLCIGLGACSGVLDGEVSRLGEPALSGGDQADEGSALTPPGDSTSDTPAPASPADTQATCPATRAFGWGACTTACPCGEGEGDCDVDSHCQPGLVCRHNVGERYGVEPTLDVCERDDAGADTEAAAATPPASALAGEGQACGATACAEGLACIVVYSSSRGSVLGSFCMERCASPGADSRCEGGESCVIAASGERVCFDATRPATGYTDAGEASNPATDPAPSPGGEPCGMNAAEAEVLQLLNAERADNGLGALACDAGAVAVARAHSQDMCERGYFSHINPEGDAPWDRLVAAGVSFMGAGENIAMGQRSAQAVHAAWMNSPGHRANMLNGTWTRVGVGYVLCGDDGAPYWTEVFMR